MGYGVDEMSEKIFQSAFLGITRDDIFAEGITSNPYRDGGIDRTKYLFISKYGNIYVLMFSTTYHQSGFEEHLEFINNAVNPLFREILNSFEYGI